MTAAELLAGIRDGNFHQGGIRCLRLMRLDAAYFDDLRSDVHRLVTTERGSNVTAEDHITNWTRPRGSVIQYSLLNTSGRFDDFTTDHDFSVRGKAFYASPKYPTLGHFIGSLPDTINVRVNILGQRARLSPHEEHSIIRTPGGCIVARARFHLPIATSAQAELLLEGAVYHLQPGIIYFVNHGCVHAAWNDDVTPRVHLVWDALLTHDSFEQFFVGGIGLPVDYIESVQREPPPLRSRRSEAFVALPAPLTRAEAENVELYDRQ